MTKVVNVQIIKLNALLKQLSLDPVTKLGNVHINSKICADFSVWCPGRGLGSRAKNAVYSTSVTSSTWHEETEQGWWRLWPGRKTTYILFKKMNYYSPRLY